MKTWQRNTKQKCEDWKVISIDLRLDNIGNVIADRKNPLEEAKKRKQREKVEFTQRWPEGDGKGQSQISLMPKKQLGLPTSTR
jgi:hypothetical protein